MAAFEGIACKGTAWRYGLAEQTRVVVQHCNLSFPQARRPMPLELTHVSRWHLKGYQADSCEAYFVPVNTWPFQIGRNKNLPLSLPSKNVSKVHAEIFPDGHALRVRDLGSRNGTFVNGIRIETDTELKPGDVLHFADMEFHLELETETDVSVTIQPEPNELALTLLQFDKLFEGDAATPYFQPIVNLPARSVFGHEVLARSGLEGLQNPAQMFRVAVRLNMEAQLSRLFRREGVQTAQTSGPQTTLFLNTHPAELQEPGLLRSLQELRSEAPQQLLVLEIHEAAVTDPIGMRELRAALTDLDIGLAYDDFGAGQARLIDLIEVPPDYVKFDMCMVRDIHHGSEQRRQMLHTLVRMAHDLGVAVLAEGIECSGECDACIDAEFDFAQGFYFGRPVPAIQAVQRTQ